MPELNQITELSYEAQIDMTRITMNLLGEWGVSGTNQVMLLGMPEGTRARHMSRYGEEKAFPTDCDTFVRAEHFIGIADALRTSYPRNIHMGKFWLNNRNKRFKNQTPLNYMLESGLNGIVAVRVHLDCAYDWQVDESKVGKL